MKEQQTKINSSRRHYLGSKRRNPPGTAPGTLAVDPNAPKSRITAIAYNTEQSFSIEINNKEQLQSLLGQWPVLWINISGLGDADWLRQIGDLFKIHPLALEDIANVHQRPKVDVYENQQFVVCRRVRVQGQELLFQQVSLLLTNSVVLSFDESSEDNFKVIRERILQKGKVCSLGADYLLYELLDLIVDSYFPVLEIYGDYLDNLEDKVVVKPSNYFMGEVHRIKRDLIALRIAIWSQRDVLNTLYRDEQEFTSSKIRIYLRDCYDHTLQILDILENYRDRSTSLIDIYLSNLNYRMNEIMKVLTIIATVFMPLGFLASLWGMNFDHSASPWNMPELHWYYGYPAALGFMLLVSLLLLYYFQRKGWLTKGKY